MGGHVADPPTEVITDAGPGSAGLGKASPSRLDACVRAAQLRRENAELKDLTERHSTMLRESTREYFMEVGRALALALTA